VSGSSSETYSYDANGNRTNTGYGTGVNNQLLTDGTSNYQYDPEGNRTKRTNIITHAIDDYTWDYRNRLTKIVSKDGNGIEAGIVAYEYDINDQRVQKSANGIVENYYLDGNQIAFVTDSGNETYHYLYGTNTDQVLAQDTPTGMVWSLADRLGSVDLLTDASGVVVEKRSVEKLTKIRQYSKMLESPHQ
jgi:uncharacterized protein RhaS with RHS repeats